MFEWRQRALICLYSSIAVMLLGCSGVGGHEWIAYILLGMGILLFCGFLGISFLFWRCPYCGEAFEMRHGKMDGLKVCPYCGKRLRD